MTTQTPTEAAAKQKAKVKDISDRLVETEKKVAMLNTMVEVMLRNYRIYDDKVDQLLNKRK